MRGGLQSELAPSASPGSPGAASQAGAEARPKREARLPAVLAHGGEVVGCRPDGARSFSVVPAYRVSSLSKLKLNFHIRSKFFKHYHYCWVEYSKTITDTFLSQIQDRS